MAGFVTPAQCYDVVSLGDVVTDQFIRLPTDSVKARSDDRGRWIEIPLGAKLILDDDPPAVSGGSAANTSAAMARLGLRVGLASFVAHDQIGVDILNSLRAEDVDTGLVHVDAPPHTIRNFVLSYGGERTVLVRHADFNYRWPGFRANDVPAWLYVSSLGPDALEYLDEVADWLDAHPAVHLAFQPGTFQIESGVKRLARLYTRADVLLCSHLGAAAIVGDGHDAMVTLDSLLALGPRRVVVYDDAGGAIAAELTQRLRVAPFPDTEAPVDRTGAGDAFAATVVAALIHGRSLSDALSWAPVNFMCVSHQLGAQAGLLREGELTNLLQGSDPPFHAESVARD